MAEPDQDKIFDVIIVGAGISGLTAAYQITAKAPDLNLLILEARDRVGGRTWTQKLKCANGEDDFDMGGQWIAENQTYLRTLVEHLGLEMYHRYSTGYKAMQFGDEIMYHTSKKIPLKWVYVMKDWTRFVDKVTAESQYVSIVNPETSSNLSEMDCMTVEEFRRKHCWTDDSSVLLDSMLSCLFGCDATQLPMSFFMYYCKAAGGLLTAAGGPASCIKGGTQSICQELRKNIGEDKVLTDSAVTSIVQDGSITVHTARGKFSCHHVIVTCPSSQIREIEFRPELPPDKRLLYDRTTPGRIIKIIITYTEPFWRETGFSGCFIAASGQKPLSCVFDSTSFNGNAALVGFIGAGRAVYWAGMKDTDRRDAVIHHLEECFGASAQSYLDYRELDWSLERYTGGGPTFPPTTGVMEHYKYLRMSAGRIHFAGTETATHCCGFMEGAVQSGFMAAKQVLYEIKPSVALSKDTPLDHIRVDHPPVLRTQPSHWSSLVTWSLLASLLAVGGTLAFARFKYR